MSIKTQNRERAFFGKTLVLAVLVTLSMWLGGCQVDVGGAASVKGFYPDNAGKLGSVGDPRKNQYAPERTEGFSAGPWSDFKGRPGEKPIGGVQ